MSEGWRPREHVELKRCSRTDYAFDGWQVCAPDGDKDLQVEMWYSTPTLFVDLFHTRASDGLKIEYSLERNGWVVYQPEVICPNTRGDDPDDVWVEVAFLESWSLMKDCGDKECPFCE